MQVTIYTTPTCAYCHMAKEYFKEKGIKYDEVDVSADSEKADEMVKKTGQMAVPVIVLNAGEATEEILIGFDKVRLEAALGIK